MYIGNEPLLVGNHETAVTVNDFWRWAFSDLSIPATHKAFAEFLVASSLGLISNGQGRQDYDLLWTPSDGSNIRINVESAICVQSDDGERLDRIAFSLSPKHTCDAHIFCIFKPPARDASPLDTGLWDFYILRETCMGGSMAKLAKLPLPLLKGLEPVWSDYYGISAAILSALSRR